ncbi:MAG: serine hydrolase domain-containing protein [Gemmatimonadaceae bacterium]
MMPYPRKKLMPRWAVALVILVALIAAPAARAIAQGASAVPDPSRIEHELRPAVRILGRPDTTFELADRMRLYHVPGVSIAVVDGDRVVWAQGFGVKTFGGHDPVDTSTIFQAGSISKPVFASGLLQLVEQGKLGLDENVNSYLRSWHLPDSRFTRDKKVTLRTQLSHSAGLTVWGFPGYAAGAPIPTIPQVLDGAKPANTPAVRNDTVPGARWMYSGGGMTIAQLVATDATGEPFPELMRRLVLAPDGMVHSTYQNPLPDAYAAFAATGHERPDTPVPGRYHTYPEMAAAGLWTAPSDLARWAIMLAQSYEGRAGGALSPAMARQMLTPQVEVPAQFAGPVKSYWGLGVELRGSGSSFRFTHDGRDEGFVADLVMWPGHERGLVIMTNGVSGALMNEIARAFGAEYGLEAVPRIEKRLVAVDSAALDSLTGVYRVEQGGQTVNVAITHHEDQLWVTNLGGGLPGRLLPDSPDSFFALDSGAEWTFERPAGNPSGAATAVVQSAGTQKVELRRVR